MNKPSDVTDAEEEPPKSRAVVKDLSAQSATVRDILVAVLAFTAGFIDALSLLGFGGVFASVMTGNTILLGLAIARGEPLSALLSAIAIAAYVGGVAVGTSIAGSTLDRQGRIWSSGATNVFIAEFLMLLALAVIGVVVGSASSSYLVYVLIALAAMSMGMQSAGFSALGISGISTTRITGTYERFMIDLLHWRRSSTSKTVLKKRTDAALKAIVVLVYVLAAIVGGLAEIHLSLDAALIPVIALGVVIIVARIRMS